MKSNLPKIFIIAVISILIFPQVSFAAWWNPFTWKIFNKTPTEKVQETKQPSEIEKLRSEVEELKKKVATPVSSATKPSTAVSDKSKATTKPVTPVAKPAVTATELKKQNPQEYKTLIDENKTKLLEASKLLSNKNIIARVKPSVVYIETAGGSGSGIIISADGYVLTNAHVVSGANSATVKLTNGASYSGSVVGRDENADLALLKISASELSAASLGDSDSVEQGDPVFTFGYPLGIEGDVAFKDGTLSRRQKINDTTYLEISAQILPGNSGGPLVNQAGEVIGVNTLAIGALKVSGILIGETLKFALPINVAKNLIPDLKNGRNVVIPKTPVTRQEPTPPLPPSQPYIPPPTTITPAPTPYQPQPTPIVPPAYVPVPIPPPPVPVGVDVSINCSGGGFTIFFFDNRIDDHGCKNTAQLDKVGEFSYAVGIVYSDGKQHSEDLNNPVVATVPEPDKLRSYGFKENYPFGMEYIFGYFPTKTGTSTLTFSVGNIRKSIDLIILPNVTN